MHFKGCGWAYGLVDSKEQAIRSAEGLIEFERFYYGNSELYISKAKNGLGYVIWKHAFFMRGFPITSIEKLKESRGIVTLISLNDLEDEKFTIRG